MKNNKKKKIILISVISAVVVTLAVLLIVFADDIRWLYYKDYKAPAPVIKTQTIDKEDENMADGDFYVSTKGDDKNSGTKDSPFRTIEKAVEAVRNTDKTAKNGITVCIEAGEYRTDSIRLTKEDSGTKKCPITYRAVGGEVVINGGVTLQSGDFKPAGEYSEIAKRLSDEAKDNVIVIDLKKEPYSLTKNDWGKIYAIGSYNTASSYDGDYTGPLYCELFVNDKRQNLARYPDNDFLYTEEVLATGLGRESEGAETEVKDWDKIRNPEPDVYKVDDKLAQRIAGWKTLDDVWMFGYWKYDWADASSPIGSFDKDSKALSPAFVSLYGTKTDAPYYFFNVLEELSAEGEWYLDRENGLLCMWKPENLSDASIELSLSLDPVLNVEADNLIFDGITLKGTRGDAASITGDNSIFRNGTIKNVAGNALIMTGTDNVAENNEITHTGKGGIIINGGDTEKLIPGNSKAQNNYIHDWSEIYLTYQPGVTLNGVGNICAHNELVNAPHEAISYSGNNHIIEYNLIHDVCLLSDDAGAIYAGRSWVWYGNQIRYNCVYNLGSGDHKPDGIYLDDALSGQKVYGNLLVNIPRNAVHIGGGRDNEVTGNIIVNPGRNAVRFDARAREGALLEDGWFNHSRIGSGDMWDALYASPWKTKVWQDAFPQYVKMTDDISQSETSDFIPNPASRVSGNLIFDKKGEIGVIFDDSYKFGDISANDIHYIKDIGKIFTGFKDGDYSVSDFDALKKNLPDFEEIPLDQIGRIN